MTETTVVPDAENLPHVGELTKEQRLSKARNAATSTVLDQHRAFFNAEMVKEAAALGLVWTPRKSEAEKALEEVEALIAKHPSLRDTLLAALVSDDDPDRTTDLSGEVLREVVASDELHAVTSGDEVVSVVTSGAESDLSRPAKAWVAGARRDGRVTLDGTTFVYVVGDSGPRRVEINGTDVKLIED